MRWMAVWKKDVIGIFESGFSSSPRPHLCCDDFLLYRKVGNGDADGGDQPAQRVDCHQYPEVGPAGKYGININNPQYADTCGGNDRRQKGEAPAPQRAGKDVHHHADEFKGNDPADTHIGPFRYHGVCGKQGYQRFTQ